MDAYDLKNKLIELWRPLSITQSGASVSKYVPEVPVYVTVKGVNYKVVDIENIDNKLVLKINDI